MKYDPQQRPTASQTLQYPFFQARSVRLLMYFFRRLIFSIPSLPFSFDFTSSQLLLLLFSVFPYFSIIPSFAILSSLLLSTFSSILLPSFSSPSHFSRSLHSISSSLIFMSLPLTIPSDKCNPPNRSFQFLLHFFHKASRYIG
jgi:hypothetical protein